MEWKVRKLALSSLMLLPLLGKRYRGYHATLYQLDGCRLELLRVSNSGQQPAANWCIRSVKGSRSCGEVVSKNSNKRRLGSPRAVPFLKTLYRSWDGAVLNLPSSLSLSV